MADATAVTGTTLAEMLTSPIAREIIAAKLRRVVIRDADQVDVKLSGDTLIVEVEAKEAITRRVPARERSRLRVRLARDSSRP